MLDKYFEDKIIETAINALKKNLPEQVYIIVRQNEQLINNNRLDLTLKLNTQGKDITYFVEVKNHIAKQTIGNLLMLKKQLPYPLLLITNHVTDFLADKLKQENIEFIDTVGNVFINQPPLFLFVKGNKLLGFLKQAPLNRAFKPTGLKIIFAFLYNTELLNKNYREIAKNAGVALGTVGWVMRDLMQLGYLIKTKNKQNILIHKEKLFEQWNAEYAERLRPKLFLGKYTGNLINLDFNNKNIRLGGETAAEKITNYLNPQITTLYAKKDYLNQFLLDYRLKANINGTIEIYDYFWNPRDNDNEQIVPPMLVYADLVATGDQRNIETADLIFKGNVIKYIREN
jgi:hypothetical protein